MLERELEAKCRTIAKRHRCRFYKFTSPGNRGVFDRILIIPGDAKTRTFATILFVELKTKTGRLTKNQEKFQRDMWDMGAYAVVIRTTEEFEELITDHADT